MAVASEVLTVSRRLEGRHGLPARALGRIAGLAVAAVVVAGTMATAGPGGSPMASAEGAPRAVVIRPGQTLWDVAERHAPEGVDLRAYVDALIEINGVEASVVAGQRIHLPR
jgi:Tfp pilus assembly protein FimV